MMPLILYRIEALLHPVEAQLFSPIRLTVTLLIAFLVVYLHRENIKRVMNKTERRFSFKRTVKKTEIEVEETVVEPKAGEVAYETEDVEYVYEDVTDEVIKRKEENRKKSKSKKK